MISQILTVPYPPTANNFKMIVRGRMMLSNEARAYKEQVGWLAKSKGLTAMAGPLSVTIYFYRPRKSGDLDNLLKVLIDSLTGIIYQDDSQIVEIHAFRFEDKLKPRAEIMISASEIR